MENLDRVRCPHCMAYLANVVTRPLPKAEHKPAVHALGKAGFVPVQTLRVVGECFAHGVVTTKA